MSEQIYFANKDSKEKASILLNRARTFYSRMETNKHIEKIKNMWKAYHGFFNDDAHEISFTGEQGELIDLPVNHFRNIARHMFTMVSSDRPIMECRAINSDYKSLAQTTLGNDILDYYMREKGLEEAFYKALEHAIVTSVGYIKLEWNATSGESYDIDPETGEFNYEGEIEFTNPTVFDVIVDGTKETWSNDWVLVRSFANKYNLAAKYPEFGEKIKELQTKSSAEINRLSYFSNDQTDDIAVYEFYHKKCEAVPEGNYCLFLSDDIILIDTVLPYRDIPVYRIVPSEILGTPYGYTPMFDIYPLQEAINALYGIVLTNQNAFGVQSVFVPRGADLTMKQVEGGMNWIEGNAKPESINLTQTPNEIFKFIADLIAAQETLSGVSSVTRGSPQASLESGAALALVQSMSLQFISSLQRSYVRGIEAVGTAVISILKDYAHTPKLIALVGRTNKPLLQEFTGDQIDSINRVVVDVGNPLSRSIAGRVQMAEQLAQMKLLRTPEQYIQVLNSGRLDVALEGEQGQLMLIRRENEAMMSGKLPRAVFLDKHRMHIREHSNVLNDPELRSNPELFENVSTHIQEHINLLRSTNPDLLAIMDEQPLNQPAQMGNPNLPPGPMANAQTVQQSNVSDVQTSPQNQHVEQQEAGMPQVPTPPAPFQNLPTNAQNLG